LNIHFTIILSSKLGLSTGRFPQVSPPKPCTRLFHPHPRYMPRPSHSSRFYYRIRLGEDYRSWSSS
jgi:hypothetical protein